MATETAIVMTPISLRISSLEGKKSGDGSFNNPSEREGLGLGFMCFDFKRFFGVVEEDIFFSGT